MTTKLQAKNDQLLAYTQELQTMLYTDSLTKLKNRQALLRDKQDEASLALILINIDSFSQINDLYGENFGNKVLISFGKFLDENLKTHEQCELYRLGADEFVILSHETNKNKLSENLLGIIGYLNTHPFDIDGQEITLSITIGVSYEDKNHLLSTANMALKRAKRTRKNLLFYSEALSLNAEYENNLHWIQEIKDAIKEDRIKPFFQPIIDNTTNRINKYETLMRLIDKDGNAISPVHFLDVAKKSKLYKKLTQILIEKSFKAFASNEYEFSINLTVEDILDKDIRKVIFETLERYNISHRVIFEIVESESIENFEQVMAFITQVKSYGCKIAIDDFGTGYSNFEYLMRLQADFIKIDGSIIKEITHNKRSEVITSLIVAFAKEMHIQTIGEYVENEAIQNKLIELGVNKSQGYFFDKPQPNLP